MRTKLFLAYVALLAASSLFFACGAQRQGKASRYDDGFEDVNADVRPNIVLIIVDALRKDQMSAYDYEHKTTPFIDSLAETGLLFENPIAQAPWTAPSVASYLTSKYPSQVGVGAKEKNDVRLLEKYSLSGLGDEAVTLAEVLKENGYRTGYVNTNGFAGAKFGMAQGFEFYSLRHKAAANVVMDTAMEFLQSIEEETKLGEGEGGEASFFLYLHMLDVHEPTNPPPPYNTMYSPADSLPHQERHYGWDFKEAARLHTREFKSFKSHKLALYHGGLRFLDSQVERLVDYLKEKGLYENTVIVIGSDHGEELWDHALYEKKHMAHLMVLKDRFGVSHGHTMFRELLDVPLIFHGSGVPVGRVNEQVRNMDIMPTLLGLAGVNTEEMDMEGVDLIALLRQGKMEDLPAFSEDITTGYEAKCIQTRCYKYIAYPKAGNCEFLFDKISDPQETVNLSKSMPDALRRLRKEMKLLENIARKETKAVALDAETRGQLKALGYIQ